MGIGCEKRGRQDKKRGEEEIEKRGRKKERGELQRQEENTLLKDVM